jgi:hypothetical protein
LKAIETIAVGDKVWSYDHRNLRWVVREVVECFQPLNQGTMATLQVKGETLRATGGHPFWVVRGEGLAERPLPKRISAYEAGGRQQGRWVLASDLHTGDEVLLRQGEVVALDSVLLDEVEERVYNFHVAELQNYAVGECGVLVHNTNEESNAAEIASLRREVYRARSTIDRQIARLRLMEAMQVDPEAAAAELGYSIRIPPQRAPFNSHGQPVFQHPKTGRYISPDHTGHAAPGNEPGVWKGFDADGNRIGTYDADLNWIRD